MSVEPFGVMARIQAFTKEHGDSCRLGGWFFYHDGAAREVEPLGALIDPPSDEYSRLTNILQYHKAKRLRAIARFDELKNRLMMSGDMDGEGISRLKDLQNEVGQMNEAVQQAEQNLANTAEGKRRAQNKLDEAERRQRLQDRKQELREIRV